MKRPSYPLERHVIAAGAALLGLFNVILPILPRSGRHLSELGHIAPAEAVNGSRFLLLILGILLLSTAPALWSGKRTAWAIALACAVVSALAHPVKNIDLWGAGGSLLLAGALLGARQQFPARSDPPRAARGAIILVAGLAGVFLYGTLGLYFLDREFTHPIPLGAALKDSLRLLFLVPATSAEPITGHAAWFLDSVRLAFLFVIFLGVWQLLQPVVHRVYAGRAERERVRALLEQYGNSSVAYFALLDDKSYFFSKRGNAVLAYKVVGRNAIVLGDPVGGEDDFPELIDSFQLQCQLNGWAYAFHQTTPRYLDLYRQHGLKAIEIGEEGIIDLQQFSLAGHQMKPLRLVMNRFRREGYRAEVLSPPHDAALLRRLREISDEWLALGKRRERTFSLGQFDESLLQECQIMVVRGPQDRIVAFANIIPSYHLPQGNFDMLRYGAEPKGVSDFLYLSLIEHFHSRGYAGMNLGLVPFSGDAIDKGNSPAERAMRLLYNHGGLLFRAKGLREFKEKFRPRWEPRYLVYSSDLQLPGIALAVARAGELPTKGDREPQQARRRQLLNMGVGSR